MGLARYQMYPDGITRRLPVASLFARCSDTSCIVQNTAECNLAQKIIFSVPSHLCTGSTRSWWMIMSLWRDTWVTVDNPHIIPLAAARGRDQHTPSTGAGSWFTCLPQISCVASDKALSLPAPHEPFLFSIPGPFYPFRLHSLLHLVHSKKASCYQALLLGGHQPLCPAEEVTQRSKRLQTNLSLQLPQFLPSICQFDNGDFQIKVQSYRKKEKIILILKIGLKHHVLHYQYFFCWVFTLFKCKGFWFLLCRKVFCAVKLLVSVYLTGVCEKSTFFI